MKKPDKQTATIQTKLEQFTSMGEKRKEKTFREAFAALLVKQYLPFSLISEKVLQDSYLAFHREFNKKLQPVFVRDKTVASDV